MTQLFSSENCDFIFINKITVSYFIIRADLRRSVLPLLTIKRVQSFAVSDDWQRVVVIKLIIKLVRVGVRVSGLWRAFAVVRRVMLLTGVVCVAALGADGKTGNREVSIIKRTWK